MNKVIPFLLLPVLALAMGACERHSWEETRKLHHHGSHGDHAGGHDDHGAEGAKHDAGGAEGGGEGTH